MSKHTTATSSDTTLSESELFNRFLDARYRAEGHSELSSSIVSEDTMMERHLSYYGFDTACLPDELADDITEVLRTCDDPLYELGQAVAALKNLVLNLQIVQSSFEALAAEARTAPPSEDASDEEYRMWEDNPRYALAESKLSYRTTPVVVEIDGVEYGGSFEVFEGILKVMLFPGFTKTTHVGDTPPDQLAKIILGEMVRSFFTPEPDDLETIEIELSMDGDSSQHA